MQKVHSHVSRLQKKWFILTRELEMEYVFDCWTGESRQTV